MKSLALVLLVVTACGNSGESTKTRIYKIEGAELSASWTTIANEDASKLLASTRWCAKYEQGPCPTYQYSDFTLGDPNTSETGVHVSCPDAQDTIHEFYNWWWSGPGLVTIENSQDGFGMSVDIEFRRNENNQSQYRVMLANQENIFTACARKP